MRFFLVIFFLPFFTFAQFHPKKIGEVTGLVQFSIWEEDTIGNVIHGSKEVVFQHNYSVDIHKPRYDNLISVDQMKQLVFEFVSIPKSLILMQKKSWRDSLTNKRVRIFFSRKIAEKQLKIAFVKRKGIWFVFRKDYTMLVDSDTQIPKHILILVNGYRGYERDPNETDNLVTTKDRYHYWYKLDDRFIDTLHPNATYYLDGSMSVRTSNHRSSLNFVKSYYFSSHFINRKDTSRYLNRLNTRPNSSGFYYRKDKGRIGGKTLEMLLQTHVKDTLDIVCHSMGYAYTLGILDVLKDRVVLGKIYILSPENGCQDGMDWSQFQEAWQYGSNLDQANPDPIWEQDGIAPQCEVKGMVYDANHGRVFIPKDWPKKNFVDSHMPLGYDWIFDRIPKGGRGSIKR